MILLEIYKDAILPSSKLRVLAEQHPDDNTIPVDPTIAQHKLSTIRNLRQEVPLDLSVSNAMHLRELAIALLDLDPNTPTLQAVPLLLEAMYLQLINFPEVNDTTTSTTFYVSEQAYDALRILTAPQTISIILNTPIPEQPIIHRSQPRSKTLYLTLNKEHLLHLEAIGRTLITRYNNEQYDSIALDWIGCNVGYNPTEPNPNNPLTYKNI